MTRHKITSQFYSTTCSIDNSACPASLWSEQDMRNIFILLLQFLIQTSVDKCMACTLCDLQMWGIKYSVYCTLIEMEGLEYFC